MAKVEINGKEFFLGKISWSGAVTKKKLMMLTFILNGIGMSCQAYSLPPENVRDAR